MNQGAWEHMLSCIEAAKGGDSRSNPEAKSWGVIAREARMIPGAVETLDVDAIRYLQRLKGGGVIDRGRTVRSLAAATGVPLVDVLAAGGWWPDLLWGAGISPVGRVAAGLRLVGVTYRGIRSAPGRFVIEL